VGHLDQFACLGAGAVSERLQIGEDVALKKNIPNQKYQVYAFNVLTGRGVADDSQSITATLRMDWGRAREMHCIHPVEMAPGYYVFDLLAEETNAEVISIYPESTTPNTQVIGCPPVVLTLAPEIADGCARISGMTDEVQKELIEVVSRCLDRPMPTVPAAGSPFDILTGIGET
jgi:hypothetical protein